MGAVTIDMATAGKGQSGVYGGLFGAAAGLFVCALGRGRIPAPLGVLIVLGSIGAGAVMARRSPGPGRAVRATPGEAAAAERPTLLAEPRGGKADDLKLIKGIGPKLEKALHDLGVYHHDQIAGWTRAEAAWVDDHLNFRGRVAREDWIAQARILARGGETEFSRRAAKGGGPSSQE